MPDYSKLHTRFTRVMENIVRRIDPRPERLRGLVLAYVAAVLAGVVFTVLHLPLPWMLGPLFVSLFCSTIGKPLESPDFLVFPVRALVGVGIGSSFSPDLLSKSAGTLFSIAMMVPYSIIITLAGVWFLSRVARMDRPTAFFSAAPGGLSDMLFLAMDGGANLRTVTLIQTARVLMIVCVIPFWLQYVAGLPLGGAAPPTQKIANLPFHEGVTILLLATVGWWLGVKLGLKGATMIGPLFLSGLLHGFGLVHAVVPSELLIFVQVTVGIVVGAHFLGITLREFTTVLFWGFILASFLVLAAGTWALLISPLAGINPTTLMLSYAPGGQVEMAILGLILKLDVAILVVHHIIRVAMVILGVQIFMRLYPDWFGSSKEPDDEQAQRGKPEPPGH